MAAGSGSAAESIDSQSPSHSTASGDLGMLSLYLARLESTVLVRALDVERARLPEPVRFGRLAREQGATVSSPRATSRQRRPATPAFDLVHVITRSAPPAEAV